MGNGNGICFKKEKCERQETYSKTKKVQKQNVPSFSKLHLCIEVTGTVMRPIELDATKGAVYGRSC